MNSKESERKKKTLGIKRHCSHQQFFVSRSCTVTFWLQVSNSGFIPGEPPNYQNVRWGQGQYRAKTILCQIRKLGLKLPPVHLLESFGVCSLIPVHKALRGHLGRAQGCTRPRSKETQSLVPGARAVGNSSAASTPNSLSSSPSKRFGRYVTGNRWLSLLLSVVFMSAQKTIYSWDFLSFSKTDTFFFFFLYFHLYFLCT